MKQLTKITVLLTALASLAGCGGSSDPDTSGNTAPVYKVVTEASAAAETARGNAEKAAEKAADKYSIVKASFSAGNVITIDDTTATHQAEAASAMKAAEKEVATAKDAHDQAVELADQDGSDVDTVEDSKTAMDAAKVSAKAAKISYFNIYTYIRKVIAKNARAQVAHAVAEVETEAGKIVSAITQQDASDLYDKVEKAYNIAIVAATIVKDASAESAALGVPTTASDSDFSIAQTNTAEATKSYDNVETGNEGAKQLVLKALAIKNSANTIISNWSTGTSTHRSMLKAQSKRKEAWIAYKLALSTATKANNETTSANIQTKLNIITTQVSKALLAKDAAESASNTAESGENSDDVTAAKDAYTKPHGTLNILSEASVGALEWYKAADLLKNSVETLFNNLKVTEVIGDHKAKATTAMNAAKSAKAIAISAKKSVLFSTNLEDIEGYKKIATTAQAIAETAKSAAKSAYEAAKLADSHSHGDNSPLIDDIKHLSEEAKNYWESIVGIIGVIANHYAVTVSTPTALIEAKFTSEAAETANLAVDGSALSVAKNKAEESTAKAQATKTLVDSVIGEDSILNAHKQTAKKYMVNAYTSATHAWDKVAEMQKFIAKEASEAAISVKDAVLFVTNAIKARELTDTKIDSNEVEANVKHFKSMANTAKAGAKVAKSKALATWVASEGYGVTTTSRDSANGHKEDAAMHYSDGTNSSATAYSSAANAAYTVADNHTSNLEAAQSLAEKEVSQRNAQKDSKNVRKNASWKYLGDAKARRLTKLLFALYNYPGAAHVFTPKEGGSACEYNEPFFTTAIFNNHNTEQITEELSKDKDRAFTLNGGCAVLDVSLTAAQKARMTEQAAENNGSFTLEEYVGALHDADINANAFPLKAWNMFDAEYPNSAYSLQDMNILNCDQQVFMLYSGWENSILGATAEFTDKNPLTYICESAVEDPVRVVGTGINEATTVQITGENN
ncbi:hypothetical protein [Bathymodiolus thermophilus thioautotrophic gill symbiont]|uniref:Lipoprotein n=1 Tax=Bathymodiolus thermophilus thioautotrophic gill symbiont TaxID=2360 RepID=A0A8H8XAS3_9GAMM|nr:hypothetical protein [Bathymodiolus thermophilus thioautotrophic gill symbiont]CAB5495546.1 hypothetical protein THERMOS_309 [Bathymodiolus thermophilus thioautotrophic gill symbiont]